MSSPKIKVLFLDSARAFDGSSQWSLESARALSQGTVEVCLACDPASRLSDRALELGFDTLALRPSRWLLPLTSWRIARYVRLHSIDLLLVNRRADLQSAALASALSGKPLVQRFGASRCLPPGALQRWIYKTRVSALVGNCQAVVTRLRENADVHVADRIRLIPNGVARTPISDLERAQARTGLGLGSDQLAVGMLARLSPMKGLHNLVGAWRLVLRRFPDARLFIAGEGQLASQVQSDLDRLDLNESVRLLGFVENPTAFMAALDLFVMPSIRDEGCNQSVLEAMAAGLPIVVTNCGGLPELIESGRSGRVAPKNHADTLADTIVDMLAHPQLRQQMAARARATVESDYKLADSIAAWERLFHEFAAPANQSL